AAVDERTKVGRPPGPDLVGGDVLARREPHRGRIVLARHREEMAPAGVVDDLAVIGGRPLRHGRRSYHVFTNALNRDRDGAPPYAVSRTGSPGVRDRGTSLQPRPPSGSPPAAFQRARSPRRVGQLR